MALPFLFLLMFVDLGEHIAQRNNTNGHVLLIYHLRKNWTVRREIEIASKLKKVAGVCPLTHTRWIE